jgi:hypothetical protein
VTREPHAALRGAEQIGLSGGVGLDDVAQAGSQGQSRHVPAERPSPMMVLAVNVRGDHSAKRHELRARRDGRKPAPVEQKPVQSEERESRFGAKEAR